MRFSLVHPQWRPPGHSSKFLGHLRGRVQQDAAAWGATSVRSPPTPRVLSDSSSPLVSRSLAAPISLPSACLTLGTDLRTRWSSLLSHLSVLSSDPFFSCFQPEAFLANLLVHPLMPPRDLSPTAPCPAAATASLLASISRIAQDPR